MTTQELITAGVRFNAIVFDDSALPGYISTRLFDLLMAVASDSLMPKDRPVRFLVPEGTLLYLGDNAVPVVGGVFWGLPVEPLPADAFEEFTRQGGRLTQGKVKLVAVVTSAGRVVLGEF